MIGRAIAAGTIAAVLAGAGAIAIAAPAEPAERTEALLFGGAIDRFVAKQLPSTFAVRGDRDAGIGAQDVTLVDARFCGPGKDPGRGRFIGLLRPAETGGPALPAIEGRDCRGKLEEAARRLAAAPDAGSVAVVELWADWAPSELRVSIGDVATAGEGGRARRRPVRSGPPPPRGFAWRRSADRPSTSISRSRSRRAARACWRR